MNIVIVSLKTENKRSGIWHYTNDLLKTLDVSEHSLSFISDKNSIDGYYRSSTIEKIAMGNYSNKIIKWLLLSFKLYRIAMKHRFDVMHFTSEDIPVIYLSFLKKIRLLPRSIKLVCTVHDLGEFVIKTKRYGVVKWALRHITIPLILEGADTVITDSNSTSHDIGKFFGHKYAKKIRIIYNPIQINFSLLESGYNSFCSLKLGRYFLYVAELHHPSKNHIRLIRAFKKLIGSEKYSDFTLVFTGPRGRDFSVILKEIDRLHLEQKVRYLGYVDEGFLLNLYKNAVALLLVSLYEGFGRPVVEGMYFGLPIIASNRGSLPEVARDAAIYIDPEDEDSICGGMRTLIDSPEIRNKLSDKAKVIISEYSMKAIKEKFLEAYRRAYECR